QVRHRRGNRDVADSRQAQKHNGSIDAGDLPRQTIKGRVDDLQDSSGEGRVIFNDVMQVTRGRLGVLNDLNDFDGYFRQGGDFADLGDGSLDQFLDILRGGNLNHDSDLIRAAFSVFAEQREAGVGRSRMLSVRQGSALRSKR